MGVKADGMPISADEFPVSISGGFFSFNDKRSASQAALEYSTAQLEIINDRAKAEIREHWNTHHRPQEPTTMELLDKHTPEWEPDIISKHRFGDYHSGNGIVDYRWTCKCKESGRYRASRDDAFRAFLSHKYGVEWYTPPKRFKRVVQSLTFQATCAVLVINGFVALVYWIVITALL